MADHAEHPFPILLRVMTGAAGPPALLRAMPPFAALFLFAAVGFGGNGMRPRDLCAVAASSVAVRAALWAAWLLVTAPAARALLGTPSTYFLRALPVPPWQFWAVHGAHLLALQVPWMVLFGIGAGPLAGLAAGIAAAAAAALGVARPAKLGELIAALALTLAIGAGAPPALLLPIAVAAGAWGVAGAWARAPERSARAGATLVRGSAPVALALTHAAVLVRRDLVVLLRGAVAALVGAVVLALVLRNNAVDDPAAREGLALAVGGIPLALATGGVAVKVLETERSLAWLLLTTGASPRLRALTAAGVSVAWGAAAGAMYGALAALAGGGAWSASLRLGLLGTALGAAVGGAAAHVARRAELPSGVDGTAATVGMLGAAIGASVLAAWLGTAAIVPVALAAAALAGSTPLLLARREHRTEYALHVPVSGL